MKCIYVVVHFSQISNEFLKIEKRKEKHIISIRKSFVKVLPIQLHFSSGKTYFVSQSFIFEGLLFLLSVFKLLEFRSACRIARFHFSGDTMRHSAYSVRQSTNLQFAHMLVYAREFTSSGVVVYSNTCERARPSFRWLNFCPFRRTATLEGRLCCVSMCLDGKFISHLKTSPLTFMVLKQ